MTHALVIPILGAAAIVLSGILTQHFRSKAGIPAEFIEHLAGTGIVPKWVSLLNIVGWVLLLVGIVRLF
jgi:hypothetical protein